MNPTRIKTSRIVSGCRNADVVKARKIVCYLYKKQGLNYEQIGAKVNYSKSGVSYAIRSLIIEMSVNKKLNDEIISLENQHIKK